MSYKPGCQSTFPPSIFTRSLAFEFLRAGLLRYYDIVMINNVRPPLVREKSAPIGV